MLIDWLTKLSLFRLILKFWVNENMKSFYTIAFLIFVVCCLIYVEESVGPSTDAGSWKSMGSCCCALCGKIAAFGVLLRCFIIILEHLIGWMSNVGWFKVTWLLICWCDATLTKIRFTSSEFAIWESRNSHLFHFLMLIATIVVKWVVFCSLHGN